MWYASRLTFEKAQIRSSIRNTNLLILNFLTLFCMTPMIRFRMKHVSIATVASQDFFPFSDFKEGLMIIDYWNIHSLESCLVSELQTSIGLQTGRFFFFTHASTGNGNSEAQREQFCSAILAYQQEQQKAYAFRNNKQ